MAVKKLSVTPKHIKTKIPTIHDGIEFDDWRRLRNALIALADLDPAWMLWVERHVPGKMVGIGTRHDPRIARIIVEQRARVLLAKRHTASGTYFVRSILNGGYYFTDDGNLKMHK